MRRLTLAALLLTLAAASRAAEIAPGPPPDLSLSSEDISDRCSDAMGRARIALRTVKTVPAAARDFADTPEAIETALTELEEAAAPLLFIAHISASSAAVSAAELCRQRITAFFQDVYADRGLYRALQQYASRQEPLAGESRLLLADQQDEFQSHGAGLDSDQNQELRFLGERITALERAFAETLELDHARLALSPEEISGLPPRLLERLPRDGVDYQVPITPAYYLPFLNTVSNRSARQRMESMYHDRGAAANGQLLKEISDMRRRYARKLGRDSYAEHLLARRLTSRPADIKDNIKTLARGLRTPARSLLNDLRAARDHDTGHKGDRGLAAWDRPYYLDQQRRRLYPDRDEELSAFFPLDRVKSNALSVIQRFLGLRLARVPQAETWSPAAELYEVRDAEPGPGDILGYFYLDLTPAESRQPFVFVLNHGHRLLSEGYRIPICVLYAGMDGRRLLRHGRISDVETLFHGLGHALAVILSHPRYARFSGANMAPDFNEVLPLILGRLSWLPEVQAALAGRSLPPALLSETAEARRHGYPLLSLEAAAFALYELESNSDSPPSDPSAAWRKLFDRVALLPTTPRTHPETGAIRLVRDPGGASDAISARFYAEAIWRRLQDEGLFNPVAGRHLRETLFQAGAGEEAQRLRNFLGRTSRLDSLPDPTAWPLPDWDAPVPEDRGSLPRRQILY